MTRCEMLVHEQSAEEEAPDATLGRILVALKSYCDIGHTSTHLIIPIPT